VVLQELAAVYPVGASVVITVIELFALLIVTLKDWLVAADRMVTFWLDALAFVWLTDTVTAAPVTAFP
jgi:hypothetical protein